MEQSYPDGSGREIATDYWRYNFEWATLVLALARAIGIELDRSFMSRYRAAGILLKTLATRAPGLIVGDTDDAVVWSRFWPFRLPTQGDDASMLEPGVSECIVTDAGLAIIAPAAGRAGLVLRSGKFGFPRMAPHSHADLLSVFLQVDGTPFIIDSGSDRYFGVTQRESLRLEEAHATLFVDGARQGAPTGRFMWTDTTDATLHAGSDTVTASLQTGDATLTRQVRWGGGSDSWFEVTDTVVDPLGRRVHWAWPLASGIAWTLADSATVHLQSERQVVRLRCETEMESAVVLQMVSSHVSPGYAALERTHVVRLSLPAGTPVRWRFTITDGSSRS